jgi:CIC family chloride channel protein
VAPWAAGAGGGIAATFNTPIGGTLFAIELVVQEVSVRTLVPVAIATVTATYVGRLFFGPYPSFVIPALEGNYFHVTAPALILPYLGLGILMGLASGAYIKALYTTEAFFERRVPGGPYLRHMLGMLLVGVLMYALFVTTGRYYTEGVGYSTIQDVLTGQLGGLWFLLLLCGLKLLATCLTLGSGASGGIFSPSLFMGATLGGAYGVLLERLLPSLPVSPAAFAVVGMAGLVSGVTGAALAAIVMIFEMTLDYSVIVPMAATVAVSYGVRWLVSEETIYTEKLVARKHYVPKALRADFHHLERARDVMDTGVEHVPAHLPAEELGERMRQDPAVHYILTEREGRVAGVIPAGEIARLTLSGTQGTPVGEIAATRYVLVHEEMAFLDVLEAMQGERAGVALVVEGARVDPGAPIVGVIDRKCVTAGLEEVVQHYLS